MDNKKPEHSTSEKILWIVLSALGVLALAVVAGILLFYKPGTTERAQFTSAPIVPDSHVADTPDQNGQAAGTENNTFDTVQWARGDGDVPDLEKPDQGGETTNADGEIVINWTPEGSGDKTTVQIKPAEKGSGAAGKKGLTDSGKSREVKPEPVKSVVSKSRKEEAVVWWIQVASFSNSFKAESFSESLYMKGIPTSIQTQDVNGKTWYRIRVGAFNSREEADSFQNRLDNIPEIDSPLIVKGTILREVPAN